MRNRRCARLPYPKFLECVPCWICDGEEVVWEGKCIFQQRAKRKIEARAAGVDVCGRASVEFDLSGLLGDELVFEVEISGERLRHLICEIVTARNPDGSVHHSGISLLEMAR